MSEVALRAGLLICSSVQHNGRLANRGARGQRHRESDRRGFCAADALKTRYFEMGLNAIATSRPVGVSLRMMLAKRAWTIKPNKQRECRVRIRTLSSPGSSRQSRERACAGCRTRLATPNPSAYAHTLPHEHFVFLDTLIHIPKACSPFLLHGCMILTTVLHCFHLRTSSSDIT